MAEKLNVLSQNKIFNFFLILEIRNQVGLTGANICDEKISSFLSSQYLLAFDNECCGCALVSLRIRIRTAFSISAHPDPCIQTNAAPDLDPGQTFKVAHS